MSLYERFDEDRRTLDESLSRGVVELDGREVHQVDPGHIALQGANADNYGPEDLVGRMNPDITRPTQEPRPDIQATITDGWDPTPRPGL
mgnify:FL=1